MQPIHLTAPWSKGEIAAELVRVGSECTAFWNSFETRDFFEPIGSAWSPADNVRHLIKSVRPTGSALRMPRYAIAMLFGRGTTSRTLERLRADYASRLAAGGNAGRFAPKPRPWPSDPEAEREKLMRDRKRWDDALAATLHGWAEADLDVYRLPHPLLGKLTIRELLFFTLYHGLHHATGVARRKGLW